MDLSLARQIKRLNLTNTIHSEELMQNSIQHEELLNNTEVQKNNAISQIYSEITDDAKNGEILRVYYNNNYKKNMINTSEMIEIIGIAISQSETDAMKSSQNEKIYDLYNEIVWEYKDNTWNNTGSTKDILQSGHLYYNKTLDHLYYYDDQLIKLK